MFTWRRIFEVAWRHKRQSNYTLEEHTRVIKSICAYLCNKSTDILIKTCLSPNLISPCCIAYAFSVYSPPCTHMRSEHYSKPIRRQSPWTSSQNNVQYMLEAFSSASAHIYCLVSKTGNVYLMIVPWRTDINLGGLCKHFPLIRWRICRTAGTHF